VGHVSNVPGVLICSCFSGRFLRDYAVGLGPRWKQLSQLNVVGTLRVPDVRHTECADYIEIPTLIDSPVLTVLAPRFRTSRRAAGSPCDMIAVLSRPRTSVPGGQFAVREAMVALCLAVLLIGCAPAPYWTNPAGQPIPMAAQPNPTLVPVANHEDVWQGVVDVVSDYFRIEREEPVRLAGNTITEGRIDTFPKPGATFLEPWEHDSADSYERLESTLQSIRRRAVVRVIPASGGGFQVEVAVYKELENLMQPQQATAGAATFRYDNSLTRVINPETTTTRTQGWIPQGRDVALEQRILAQLQYRFTPRGRPVAL